jgi:hypothetical protein
MRFTDDHGIPCLELEDYAAYALYMKCVAEQVEARVVADQAAVTAMLERPVAMWTNSSVLVTGQTFSPGLGAPSTSYRWNAASGFGTLNQKGWWHIGMYSHIVSSAPVVNNHRTGQLYVWGPYVGQDDIDDLNPGAALAILQDVTWEANTGDGEDILSSLMVYNPGASRRTETEIGLPFTLVLSVETGGVENVTFTSTVWASYMGDTPAIGAGV